MPNPENLGSTHEIPYTIDGEVIRQDMDKPYNKQENPARFDRYGLDSEGLVALKDASFWVSDEYGPHIVHFDANGREIARINPFIHDKRVKIHLPREFAQRRANRGMEGIAITPDEKILIGMM